jgi:hypothetical protein
VSSPDERDDHRWLQQALRWFEVLYFSFGIAFAIEIRRIIGTVTEPVLRRQLFWIWGGELQPPQSTGLQPLQRHQWQHMVRRSLTTSSL